MTFKREQAKRAKRDLKRKGWTYREAAPVIGRSYQWICMVLNGVATSQPVIDAVFNLPVREKSASSGQNVVLNIPPTEVRKPSAIGDYVEHNRGAVGVVHGQSEGVGR